jgi:DNA-binding transcriptional MocR family regulator
VGQVRYKAVLDELAAAIRAGRLRPGARLPTHRDLARQHGLALATATRVYAELEAIGLVVGETGRGTFVRDRALPRGLGADLAVAAPRALDLSFSDPGLPGQSELLREALRRVAASGDLDSMLHYHPYGGRPHERAIVARHLRRRGLRVGGESVLIVNGAQHGLAVAALGLLNPGDVVAVDALTYPGFRVLAERLRLELAPVPARGGVTDLEALGRLCKARPVRAVYTMPTLHNPLGTVMDAAARQRLVAIARSHDLLLIEDEAYAFLAADAPPAVAALAPERTVHVASLSKSVATGLRFGFVAAPEALAAALERAVRATAWHTAGVITAIGCAWIEDGTVARLEADKRKDASRRQAVATRALAGLTLVRHPRSYFVWLPLGEDQRAERIAAALAQRGVAVSTAEGFATTTHVPQALRIALGSVSLEELPAALAACREVIEHDSS